MADDLPGVAGKGRYFAMGIDATTAVGLGLLAASIPRLTETSSLVPAVVVYLLYFLVQEALWSTTLGKRVFGLYVLHADGSQCGWTGAIIRTAARVIEVNPAVPFGALPGARAVAFTRRRQRLGDLVAGTVVTARRKACNAEGATTASAWELPEQEVSAGAVEAGRRPSTSSAVRSARVRPPEGPAES